ncbi:MAG: 2-oxoglutarate dehydrogenase E1 component, partial [Bhargavaea sp.]
MSNNFAAPGSPWGSFSGPNLGYVMEQYELFQNDPDQVDPDLAELFRSFGAPVLSETGAGTAEAAAGASPAQFGKIVAAAQLADSIRQNGHLAANIFPLKDRELDNSRIVPSAYGLTEADLVSMPASIFFHEQVPEGVSDGLGAINHVPRIYTGKAAYEFTQVIDP